MLKQVLRRLAQLRARNEGALTRMVKDPGFELYARRLGHQNRKAFLADKARGNSAVVDQLAPFKAPAIPKIIWMFWQQGEAEAPFVVRRCIDSWRRHNPGWEVRVLDGTNVADYADMSDFPYHLGLPGRFEANLLRLRLLQRHGGVWADATVYCHRPLDAWLTLHSITGFFAFRHPGPGRWIESWFLAAEQDHILTRIWEQAYGRYLRRLVGRPGVYFVFFYTFQWQLKRNPKAHAAWLRGPSLPAQPTFFMMEALRGILPVTRLAEIVRCGTPVSKLTWKEGIEEAEFDALCTELEAQLAAGPDA